MDVTLHTPATIYSPRHVPSWLLLAGSAGLVNGVAFLMCEQYVTHVTGTVTRLGLEWPRLGVAAEYAAILICFLAGAVSAVVTIQARARRGKQLRWAVPLLTVALILTATAVAGEFGTFGQFSGTHAADPPPVLILSVLAFAMGLQNAAVASTTGLAVRTTHLTGPTTDLGIHLGTACMATGDERRDALRGAALRVGKIVAFMLGASLALPLAGSFGFLALLAPAVLILIATILSFVPNWGPGDFPYRVRRDLVREDGRFAPSPLETSDQPAASPRGRGPG